VNLCPIKIKGDSTACDPSHIRIKFVLIKDQATYLNMLIMLEGCVDFIIIKILRTKIALINPTSPPNLFGIDRRTA